MGSNRSNYPSLVRGPGLSTSNYGSVNGNFTRNLQPSRMNWDGWSIEGRLSPTRRFFLMLTVFDVLFTFLIWLISTVVSSDSISSAFQNEVINYNIQTSMFDLVVLALARLILIVLFYVFIKLSHWWMVAVTTFGTTTFIIAKVFLYKWAHSNSTTASVVLLLSSFVLSWGETWFLDFRVLPNELEALAFLAKYDDESAPVLGHAPLSRSQSDDGSAFYSPPGSDAEEDSKENDGSTVSEVEWLTPKNSRELPSDKDYTKLAEDALQKAIGIIESGGWIAEKTEGNDAIYSKSVSPYGKVFKYEGILDVSPEKIIDILYYRGEEMHKWNPTVKRMKIVKTIDDHTDIAHVIATEGAAGLVSSRDFVNVRIWKKNDKCGYVHGSVATTHPDVPVGTKCVRGEQGPCAYILNPVDGRVDTCKLQWLLNTNLKGWIPQYLIDQTLSTVMTEYVASLRKFSLSVHSCT